MPRQCLAGPDPTKETNTILRFADWISSSEYDAYLSSAARPQADKDGVAHLIDICKGPSTTPLAAWYLFSGMRCPKKNQAALAAGLDAYLRGIFHCGTFAPVFHHVGVSQSDPELIISVQGWPSREAADEYWHVSSDSYPREDLIASLCINANMRVISRIYTGHSIRPSRT